jgi:hypothetical protein
MSNNTINNNKTSCVEQYISTNISKQDISSNNNINNNNNNNNINNLNIDLRKISYKEFINIYYNIYSYFDLIKIIKNHNIPNKNSIIRIINYTIYSYIDDIKFLDNSIISFLYETLIKNMWNEYYYDNIKKYLYFDGNKISLSKKSNIYEKNENVAKEYIFKNIINIDIFSKYMDMTINIIKNKYIDGNYYNYIEFIRSDLLKYLIKMIKLQIFTKIIK